MAEMLVANLLVLTQIFWDVCFADQGPGEALQGWLS